MKRLLTLLVVGALLGGGAFLYYRDRSARPPSYRTALVERGDVQETVTATGTINAVTTVQVGSQVSGTIVRLFADFNSVVRKGQEIARLDPSRFAADVEQARGTLANASAQVEKARILLADAERTLKRNEELLSSGYVSQLDVDNARTTRDGALAALKSAEGILSQAKGTLASAETNLRYASIHSPVDGIVISRNVDVGQTVAASFQTPTLFTIAQDLTRMQVDAGIDEADIGKIAVGQKVTFTVDAWPGRPFEGRVSQLRNSPTVTQNVVTYNVVVQVDNKELRLRPGMTANVSILIRSVTGVLRIPNAALRFRPASKEGESRGDSAQGRKRDAKDGSRVYALGSDGKPKPVPVSLGISDGAFTELVSGVLDNGSRLVVGEQRPNGGRANASTPPGMGGMGGLR